MEKTHTFKVESTKIATESKKIARQNKFASLPYKIERISLKCQFSSFPSEHQLIQIPLC